MSQQENSEKDLEGLDVIHISLSKQLANRLREMAKEEHRSLRGAVLVLIEEALKARGISL